MVPFLFVDGVLTLVLDGQQYQIQKGDANYEAVRALLVESKDREVETQEFVDLLSIKAAIEKFGQGKVEVRDGQVYYAGEPVHNTVSRRITEFMSAGLPFEPLMKFLERLMQNPSYQSQVELYDFLEHKNLPITEDGCFLAYKAVRSDFMDKYSGTISNAVGNVVKMTRSKVDDNRSQHCSAGLHCGALDYVRQYGNGTTDKVVIVKVDPAHAVSVPTDHSFMKLRVCEYEVVGVYTGELTAPCYSRSSDNGCGYTPSSSSGQSYGGWNEYAGDDDTFVNQFDDEDECEDDDDNFDDGDVSSYERWY